jgi:hypothetical protein
MFDASNGTGEAPIRFDITNDTLDIIDDSNYNLKTTQVFRDLSAWYHFVIAYDTTQATASNRLKVYVNGQQITTFSTATYPALDALSRHNNNIAHNIGRYVVGASRYFSGYLADIHFIDGQALDPTSFGEFSATTGVWVPKAYSGTYGTNGFQLTFADNSAATATTLGKDAAGSNNWTPNNLSVTAGAGNDSLVDVPTNGAETDTGAGGEVRGNYCTLNALDRASAGTLSNGNLKWVGDGTSSYRNIRGTHRLDGKIYFEATVNSASVACSLGIAPGSDYSKNITDSSSTDYFGSSAWGSNSAIIGGAFGTCYSNGSSAGSFTGANGDILMCAFDSANGKVWFGRNGTWLLSGNPGAGTNPTFTIANTLTVFPAVTVRGSDDMDVNFGQRPFAYTAPSGFKALNTANLPAPVVTKANQFFDVALYTGNGGTQAITLPGGMSPDLVWIKGRSVGYGHRVFDTVRGTGGLLYTNATDAEVAQPNANDTFSSFNSNGFSLGAGIGLNQSSATYAAWAWDAGSSTVTNTQGSITSQVRANVTAGFSVVTFTYPSSGSFTVGHGLGVTPSLIITKHRNRTSDWYVYHSSATTTSQYLVLNSTAAVANAANVWGSGSITSVVFGGTVSTSGISGDTEVSYCFAPVAGYSNGFSYTGNGSTDGSFVYLGFRPRLILLKCSSTTGNWTLVDTAREGYNVDNDPLYPNLSDAEGTADLLDITSNGFKLRTTDASVNSNAATYIGFAWAESPFNYSRAR